MDFIKPLSSKAGGDARFLSMARWVTVAWGGILAAVGLIARHWGSVLEAGLSIASVLYGGLLGVFLLGTLTRRVGEGAAMAGMAVGLLSVVGLKLFTPVAFTWYVLFGTSATFATGVAISFFVKEEPKHA